MPRPRPPHLQREITRHGKAVWYVRVDRGPRVRIKAEFGTPEFDSEYRAALAGNTVRKATPSNSSLAWLLARYRETTAWSELSPATRRARENIFARVIETAGQEPYARITAATIEAGKERRATTPHAARNFLDTMRGLFRWTCRSGNDQTGNIYSRTQPSGAGEGAESVMKSTPNFESGAQEKTRTSTPFRALAPEASASTSSATWA
jgi:hypothetical protein